ncbi:MAG: hypothetical protein IT376_17945 [Polyangiaceae bacterium]|nr:hypothetical protein [Polyangiaceae bacterium]
MRVTSLLVLPLLALPLACGGSTTDPGLGGTGGSAGASGAGGSSGTGGASGAGGSSGTGGVDCGAYADETPPTTATVRLVNARSAPIYLGGGDGCGEPMLYELRGPEPGGELRRLQVSGCGFTCEDLQEHSGGCPAACLIPPVTKIAPGGHRDLVWSMTTAASAAMPAACYAEPGMGGASCDRWVIPPSGTYLASATAGSALVCNDVGLCDCDADPDGSCQLWGDGQPDGEPLTASASFAFPSETTIVLTFGD